MKNKTDELYLKLAKHIRESVLGGNFDITVPIWGDDTHNIVIDEHEYTIYVAEVFASVKSRNKLWMYLPSVNDLFTFTGEDLTTVVSVLKKKEIEMKNDMDELHKEMKQKRINRLKEELAKLEG